MKQSIEYSFGSYQIKVNYWLLIGFLLVQTLLNQLGFWQLERAQEKQWRVAQLEKGSQSSLTSLSDLSDFQINQFQAVELELQLVDGRILLLDNKIDNKRPGYHVLHVAREKLSGKTLLVNRGWVFAGVERNSIPVIDLPELNWTVRARLYPIAVESMTTAGATIEEFPSALRLPVLDLPILEQLKAKLALPLQPYLLRLNEESDGALLTNWMWTNMPAEKHLAYAFQWFALALAFLIICLVVSIKKR